MPPPGYRIADTAPVAPPSQKKKKKKKAKRRRPPDEARRASSASDPVKRPRRSCTESSWGDAPDYGCAAYDDRVDAAVRAGAVLFPKRSW